MVKLFHRASKKAGMKPGSVVYIGRERSEPVSVEVLDYSETELRRVKLDRPEEAAEYKKTKTISWVNVDGLHDAELVDEVGRGFGLTDLVNEDIVNTSQRPKLEDTPDYLFFAMKMLYFEKDTEELVAEQVSVVFGENWVLTFQETGEDVFDVIRKRIDKTVPRVRLMSSEYLAYSLIDAVVDNYFIVLERLGEQIEKLDDEISEESTPQALAKIRTLKKQMLFIRKSVWPLREVVSGIERLDTKLLREEFRPYWRDLYEHTIQAIDTIETFREMVSSLLELYHTGVSNKMNEVMKVLTIFATIFIPLGFLAGVYGMNFDTSVSPYNLPELGFEYGYILFWCLAAGVGGGLLWFFKRKGWM